MKVTRERMTRINLSPHLNYARGWTMRVWRDEPPEKQFEANQTLPDPDVLMRINSAAAAQVPMSPYDLAVRVLELDRVAAVEVTDTVGAGEVLYKNWPA